MTKKEAAIVSAYTGYLCGDFDDLHAYLETLFGRPIFTHELPQMMDQIHERSKPDFLALEVKDG